MESQQSQEQSETKNNTNTLKPENVEDAEFTESDNSRDNASKVISGSVVKGSDCNVSVIPELSISLKFKTFDGRELKIDNSLKFPHLSIPETWVGASEEIESSINSIGVNPFLLMVRKYFQDEVEANYSTNEEIQEDPITID